MKPTPPAITVYNGTLAEGQIEDYGKAGVVAYVYRGKRRFHLGIFASRKAAIGAVSEAAKREAVSDEQSPQT
jgi:hypothetical protein